MDFILNQLVNILIYGSIFQFIIFVWQDYSAPIGSEKWKKNLDKKLEKVRAHNAKWLEEQNSN